MPVRPSDEASGDPTWTRLEDQISWYEAKSTKAHRAYKRLKIGQIALVALIPFLAAVQDDLQAALPPAYAMAPMVLIAFVGLAVIMLEVVQHLNQYQQNWIHYRSTCEALKREKYLFLADAGPYARLDDTRGHLAERVEELISGEQSTRFATLERASTLHKGD